MTNVEKLRHAHAALTVAWAAAMPIAIVTRWIYSLAFISTISIYANFASHFSSWQGTRAEEEAAKD